MNVGTRTGDGIFELLWVTQTYLIIAPSSWLLSEWSSRDRLVGQIVEIVFVCVIQSESMTVKRHSQNELRWVGAQLNVFSYDVILSTKQIVDFWVLRLREVDLLIITSLLILTTLSINWFPDSMFGLPNRGALWPVKVSQVPWKS